MTEQLREYLPSLQRGKAAMSDVPEGYKMSEVGVIPEDWDVETLGDIFTFGGGYSASWDQLSSDGYCYLHYGDIHKSTNSFIDVRAEYPDIPKLDILLKHISPKSLLYNGDIVFVDASEDDEGTSRHIVVVNNENITYISGLHTIVAKSKVAVLDNEYKRYCFQSRDIKKQFYFYAVGTKVSGISKTNIAKLKLPIPPRPEQKAIASALSDVDALIAALEQHITKKRSIKQGAMQQLLTGKKRLPGFGGAWEEVGLGNECELITKGTTPMSMGREFKDNGINFIKIESLEENGNIIKEKIAFIDEETHILLKRSQLKENDILISIAGALGRIAIVKRDVLPANTNQALALVRLKQQTKLNQHFLFYFLHSPQIKNHINNINVQAAQANLSLENINDFKIIHPPLSEQQAIAQILSDMDTELEALEQKRNKYKAIKQGMMQELLTGKRRLV